MISRRELFAAFPVAALLPALVGAGQNAVGVKIGCQTNAWRIDSNNFDSLLDVLRRLKELGYEGFETGFRNVQGQFANASAARKQIEQIGLQFLGCHIFLEEYDARTRIAPMELIRSVAEGAAALGAERLILSGGGLIQKDATAESKIDAGALARKAMGVNAAGRYCRAKGLRLAYHNHGPEFANDGEEIEGLYRQTEPGLVDFLTDCGWAFSARADVPKFFEGHHKRIAGLHLRDFKNGEQVPLGQGNFPIRELASAIKKANWQGWIINEEERLSGEKLGEKAVAPARQTVRQMFGK